MDDYDLSEDQDSTNSEEMDSLLLQAYTNTVPVNMISANSSYSTESGEIKEMPLPQPPPPPPEQITLNLITIDDSDDSDDDKKGKRGPVSMIKVRSSSKIKIITFRKETIL